MIEINKLLLPDYKNCIANLPNSVLKYFGVPTVGDTLPLADRYLTGQYKNVVVLLLDGMGTYILEKNLPKDGFFRQHLAGSYDSVFPPTTVAATTSADSGLQPIEHSWLGWDCYYPQVDKNVTVFFNVEQGTENPVADSSAAQTYCGYKSTVQRLTEAGRTAYYDTPFVPPFPNTFDAVCSRIEELCREDGNKYIYSYWSEPDGVMHRYGAYSPEAKSTMAELEAGVQKMCAELDDTLLIITADHGHVDGRNVVITDYPKIMECLKRLPSIEPRALNLFVKDGMKEQFEREFEQAFGNDFVLLTKQQVYDINLFGNGTRHVCADGMIGDYVAVAVTDLTVFCTHEEADSIVGVHAGSTAEEMTIPFIVIS